MYGYRAQKTEREWGNSTNAQWGTTTVAVNVQQQRKSAFTSYLIVHWVQHLLTSPASKLLKYSVWNVDSQTWDNAKAVQHQLHQNRKFNSYFHAVPKLKIYFTQEQTKLWYSTPDSGELSVSSSGCSHQSLCLVQVWKLPTDLRYRPNNRTKTGWKGEAQSASSQTSMCLFAVWKHQRKGPTTGCDITLWTVKKN